MSPEKPATDDANRSSTNGDISKGSDVSEEDVIDGSSLDPELSKLDSLQTEAVPHRPDSILKLPHLPRINAARSLNDLASPIHNDSPVTFSRCSSSGDMRHPSPHGHQSAAERINPTNVALAISYKLIDDEWLWEKVR